MEPSVPQSAAAERLRAALLALQDVPYRDFHTRLMPTVDPARVIGIRIPALRRLAASVEPEEAEAFLCELPHWYYEENNLHGILLCDSRDFDRTVARLDAFLPWVDNWATCDLLRPRAFRACPPELEGHIRRWMADAHPYTVRFGIEMLMCYYLDRSFRPEFLDWVAEVHGEEYYVNMMVAWYFATALAKQYDAALPVLQQRRLPVWTHNKTIQKAVESYRLTDEQKGYLRSLKIR